MPPPSPPHWTTWEFYLYYVAAALVIPYMIYVPTVSYTHLTLPTIYSV